MFVTENKDRLKSLLLLFTDYLEFVRTEFPSSPMGPIADDFLKNEIDQEEIYNNLVYAEKQIVEANEVLMTEMKIRKGEEFRNDFLSCFKHCEGRWYEPIELISTPIGDYQEEHEFGPHIPGMWVDQRCRDDSCWGTICIQIEPDQYLKFHFSM